VFGVENPFKSEREEKFFTLQLEVKHKRNILESLDLFVEGEMLEGDNKYFCEKANQKVQYLICFLIVLSNDPVLNSWPLLTVGLQVDAMKRVCIKELPRTLILHLKRFEFDLDFMKKVKVNDCCEFPTRLNMHPYTLAGIEEREKAIAEAVITFDSSSTSILMS
jgi:ubiquitin carboxyl-terminal hydrolase 34